MFFAILKKERLSEIIVILDRDFKTGSIKSDVSAKLNSIKKEIMLKNNEFAQELAMDKFVLRIYKTIKLRKRAQEGNRQLHEYNNWLISELESRINIFEIHKAITDILNYFEEYITRLKERETAIIEALASLASLFIAIIAIAISLIAICLG